MGTAETTKYSGGDTDHSSFLLLPKCHLFPSDRGLSVEDEIDCLSEGIRERMSPCW